jgi:hypothetical protein
VKPLSWFGEGLQSASEQRYGGGRAGKKQRWAEEEKRYDEDEDDYDEFNSGLADLFNSHRKRARPAFQVSPSRQRAWEEGGDDRASTHDLYDVADLFN